MKRNLFIVGIIVLVACGACNRFGGKPQPTPTPAASTFESDLNYVKRSYTYGLDHIYVIARTDGAPLAKEDRKYLSDNIPREVYTTVVTDNGRRVIVGTNVDLSNENRQALMKRFTIEDYTNK